MTYARDNAESLKIYRAEIDSALCNYYHFKHGLDSPYFSTIFPPYLTFDMKLHKEGKSSQTAAKIIYETVIENGEDGNPDIFESSYSLQKLPYFYKFNKVFLGSYNPTAKTKLVTYSIYVMIGLLLYGIPQILFGPEHDVFITSQDWKNIATPLAWGLTILLIFLLYRNQDTKQRLLKKFGQVGAFLMKLLFIPLILGFSYFSITIGAGKAFNDLFGKEQTIALVVEKDLKTRKRSGKHYVTAYCVKINAPDVSALANEYCLQKEHYDQIRTTAPIMMRFHGTKSFFGFHIDGYYAGLMPLTISRP